MTTEPAAVTSRTVNGTEYPAVGTYAIDPSHTQLGFAVRHSLTIDATSVDTRDENRDNHLRTNDFFDVENHPTWTFTSTAIAAAGPTEWKVTGDLTIRGVTRPVTLDVTLEGVVKDPYGNHRVGFSASTEINREDFDVSFGAVMEAGGLVVAKKVGIEIELEAVLQA